MAGSLSIFVTALLAVTSITAAPTCDLNMDNMQEKIMQYSMECMSHNPALMMKMMGHMDNPDSMAQTQFICSNQGAIVDIIICMKEKVLPCVPDADARSFLDEIASRERLADVVKFACDHKEELMSSDQCFDAEAQQEFVSCYAGKVNQLASSFMVQSGSVVDYKKIVCEVIGSEEACIRAHHGSCAKSYVRLLIQILEKFFPMDGCPKMDNKLSENPFDSILVHGEPLKFQPSYKVVNGNGK